MKISDEMKDLYYVCNHLDEYIERCPRCDSLIKDVLTYRASYCGCWECGFSFQRFYEIVNPVVDESVRKLCSHPYPLHKKGCPNLGKRKDCPPFAPLITDVLDFDQDIYAIYNIFDYKSHVEKMRDKHPDWSERQARCVLYWQPTARKELKKKIRSFLMRFPKYHIIKNPEAQGVNLTMTMKEIEIELEWPPENLAYQIVLAGTKL